MAVFQHPQFSRIAIFYTDGTEAAADDFVTGVLEVIEDLFNSQIGQMLLQHLQTVNTSGTSGILIRPRTFADPASSDASFTHARDFEASYAIGSSAHLTCHSTQVISGTGIGSVATIFFELASSQTEVCSYTGNSRAVLFHEFVHALRIISGTQQYQCDLPGFDTYEEFVAITVSNLFHTEVGMGLLLDHHCTPMLLPAPGSSGASAVGYAALGIIAPNFGSGNVFSRLLRRMGSDVPNRPFYITLGQLPVQPYRWNPFRGWALPNH